jgi:hypothetical protein
VDDIQRTGQELRLRFASEVQGQAVVAVLHGGENGRWSGELTEGGRSRAVVLRRKGP